ncbi:MULTISPECIES: hypothetical protein [unclassified Lysinibacillus]|uniref:hypothetical protein n=1 Tax=unclassified Lysinibacillus TaxID=2636778 RepID=UPI00232D6FEF|nr:hypothetical protein [Lysinibacillus sp. OF-1]WCH47175.1 hypothetical protein NV349_19375 [Lysinibacillus sp. OF-1]
MITEEFRKISSVMGSYLTYEQLFPYKPSQEEVIKDIQSIEVEKALAIISKFTLYNEQLKKEQVQQLKDNFLCEEDVANIDSIYLFDFINLNYAIKMFLAYGLKNPTNKFENNFSETYNVLLTVLKITSLIKDDVDTEKGLQETILKTWLASRTEDITRIVSRQYEIYENIFNNFDKNDPEFIDIHTLFEEFYGYSIKDYISVIFPIHAKLSRTENETLLSNELIGISEDYYKTTSVKNIYKKILDDLTVNVDDLKKWALNSIENYYDAEGLISKPIFYYDNHYVIFSLPFLEAAMFDGLWFKLLICCRKNKKNFPSFYGRLFEKYVNNILESSIKKYSKLPYEFIEEFKFGHDNLDSSDAYVKIGKSLLIVEAKGGKIRKETKVSADNEVTSEDFKKYAINPILQANEAYEKIIKNNPNYFGDVKKIYILSVFTQRFPKIPLYEKEFVAEMKNLNKKVKFYDYISLSDLEVLCSHIENKETTIFNFIEQRNRYSRFLPLEHSYGINYGLIDRPEISMSNFKKSTNSVMLHLRDEQA